MTNLEVVKNLQALFNVKKKVLPAKLSYAIGRNISILEPLYDTYFEERQKIHKQYCKLNEKGELETDKSGVEIPIDADNKKILETEMESLVSIDNSGVTIHMVSDNVLDLCDLEKFNALTPEELLGLSFMFE